MSPSNDLDQTLRRFTAPSARELFRRVEDGRLECLACAHRCRIGDGHAGVCRVRYVEGGELRRPRGYTAGLACDPVEKKPFFHAFPGRDALTFGMLGCDLHCDYCQNWQTSQVLREPDLAASLLAVSAREVAGAARTSGARLLVSSYNEPLITADWAMEIFEAGAGAGFLCGFVSNGNATPEVLSYLRRSVRIFKVDLKGFQEATYRKLGGKLSSVLETIRRLHEDGFWVEVVTLVVPGLNDDAGELRAMAEFIADVAPSIPWHVTAFHPDYKMLERGATPAETLFRAYDLGREAGLSFVYTGNLRGGTGDRESTWCPGCSALLIRRSGFLVLENRMRGSRCPDCGAEIAGVWEEEPPRRSAGTGLPRRVGVGRRIFE